MQNLNRREFFGLSLSAIATISLAACGQKEESGTESTSSSESSALEPGHITSSGTLVTPYDEGYDTGLHHATIVVKDFGTIKVELDADTAPISVSNFAHLANAGFYDGLTFHRIIGKDDDTGPYMIQGGAPSASSNLDDVVNVLGEFSGNGIQNDIKHERGVISMARASTPNSGSTQFFIMHEANDYLDGNYAAFGHVTDGMDVVDQIAATQTDEGNKNNGAVESQNQPVIESIKMDD